MKSSATVVLRACTTHSNETRPANWTQWKLAFSTISTTTTYVVAGRRCATNVASWSRSSARLERDDPCKRDMLACHAIKTGPNARTKAAACVQPTTNKALSYVLSALFYYYNKCMHACHLLLLLNLQNYFTSTTVISFFGHNTCICEIICVTNPEKVSSSMLVEIVPISQQNN